MKKIIIIGHEPLTIKIKSNFLIDDFFQNGFDVEYYDLSGYLYSDMSLPDTLNEVYVLKIKNWNQLLAALNKINVSQTIIVVEIFNNWGNRHLFKEFTKRNLFTIKLNMYGSSISIPPTQRLRTIKFGEILKTIHNRISMFAYKQFCKLYNIKPYKIVFNSSGTSNTNQSEFIKINHPDYEKAMQSKDCEKIVPDKYCVFLDEYFPLHPDCTHFLGVKLGNPAVYYNAMNHFFSHIEHKYNLEVIIAAHPKSDYTNVAFNNRKTIKYKSCELVRHCEFAIAHSSASISFAIIYNKPILFIFTDDYKRLLNYPYQTIVYLSSLFEYPNINIDKAFGHLIIPETNNEEYLNFKYKYLTDMEIENKTTSQIVIEKLKMF